MSDSLDLSYPLLTIFPRSVKEVFFILQNGGKMTLSEIKTQSNYSLRTIQKALNQLKQIKWVSIEIDMTDMRYNYYRLVDDVPSLHAII